MPRPSRTIPWLQVRDQVYYVFWYDRADNQTKRLSLRTSDSVEAQKRYAEFLATGHELFSPAGGSSKLTVETALDQYYQEHVILHTAAPERQEYAIRNLKAWFKSTPLEEIDIPACRAYGAARRMGVVGREATDSTIRRELGALSAAAGHADRWKRIGLKANPPTPMPAIELPPEAEGEAAWLTHDELNTVFAKAEGVTQDFVTLAYYTAGRRASIERLMKVQVDLKAGTINLRSPFETQAQRRSKKRRPVVPIDPLLRPTIERLMARDGQFLVGNGKSVYERVHVFLKGLKLPEGKTHPHVFRHSRATHLLQAGVPIYDVARLLGDTVQTVERVYGHHSPEVLAQALKKRS